MYDGSSGDEIQPIQAFRLHVARQNNPPHIISRTNHTSHVRRDYGGSCGGKKTFPSFLFFFWSEPFQ